MTNKFKQVLISAYGAPEVLTVVEANVPQPKPGEVIIQTEAIDPLRSKGAALQEILLHCNSLAMNQASNDG